MPSFGPHIRQTDLHDIFVSYQSRDWLWVPREVSQRAGREVLVWWDQQGIGPGDDWNEKMLDDARWTRVFCPGSVAVVDVVGSDAR